ncbi:MAG: 50S ribosomal protein L23 [Bacilli bacterium]|nr:50S ribosomal protein L23 [Bacilli bacterium]
MKSSYEVLIRPIITEKNVKLAETRKYVFEVAPDANKIDVKNAVEEAFKVKVVDVNIINVRKKPRKVGKYEGLKAAVRKAIVTLSDKDKLDIYEI